MTRVRMLRPRVRPQHTYEFMQHGDYTDSAREYIARGRFDSFARPATGADSRPLC